MTDANYTFEGPISERGRIRKWISEFENTESSFTWTQDSIERNAVLLGVVLNFLPNPFYVIDTSDYTIKAANAAAKFARLSKDATCYALTHKTNKPCNSAEHPCPVEKIKETKRPMMVEHLHYDDDGNPKNVEVHAFPIFDKKGSVSHVIEYVMDITERKQAEDALKWELAVNSALSKLYEPLTSPESSMKTVANIVLEQAKILSGSAHGYVSEIDHTTGDNVTHTLTDMFKGSCSVSGKKKKIVFPREKGGRYPALWGHSLNTREAFWSNSPREHQASSGVPEGHIPIQRFLSVPVMWGEELVGQIALANKEEDYTEGELKAICRLSEFYALAIQHKRSLDALQRSHEELELRVEERTAELKKSYREKAFIREMFGTYMSDEVVSEILKSPEGVKLGGEMRQMTILVSDLREFAAVTESMEASQIVQIINRYLEKMIPIILRHGGTIDEFMGDGILVFFGAPRLLSDHPGRAVACGLKMQETMQEINNENIGLGLPPLQMGIGISYGQLVVGNIGAEKRKKYGAVGSPINVAFRLEKKARPGEVLVTEAVKKQLTRSVQIGSHWNGTLKGIGRTGIYSVVGMKETGLGA